MLISYKRGQGSIVLRVKILNSSVSTGAGLTGLSSASAGLIIAAIADNEATTVAYTQAGSTIESITTLGTYAAPTATKCRFKEVDATNHKGVYEIQLADTRFSVTSAKSMIVSISGATNLAETDVCVPLTDLDPYEPIRAGLTALPAFAAGANGGVPVLSSGATTLAYTVSTLTTYTGNTPQTGDSFARIGAAGAGLTALGDTRIANLDAAVTTRMATYTQPTGFLAAVFPTDPADQSLIIAATNAIVSLIGSPSATLAGDIAAVKVDTAAVKLKTDQLTFTVALSVDATASVSAASIRSAIGMATNDLDTQLDAILAASSGGVAGSGSSTYVVTVDDGSNPLDGAEVWVSTDLAGTSISAGTLHTDAFGVATFLLDPGDYFLWVQHARYNGTNPTAFTVT